MQATKVLSWPFIIQFVQILMHGLLVLVYTTLRFYGGKDLCRGLVNYDTVNFIMGLTVL